MGGRTGHVIVALVVLGLVATSGLLAATDTASYSVESTTSIDTPERTLSVEGEEYTVSSLGYINEGERLQVEVSRPGDDIFTLYLYNIDREIVDSVRRRSNGTYAVETGSLSPGTYVLSLDVSGVRQTIQPVVVSGHNFTVNAPDRVSTADSISVTTTVSGDPHQVDVVLFNESWSRTATAARIGENEYNRIFDDTLAPGEYTVYVVARGTETFDGEHELTGLSSIQTVHVEGTDNPTTTTTQETTTPPQTSTTPVPTESTTPPNPTASTQAPTSATTIPTQSTTGEATPSNQSVTVRETTSANSRANEATSTNSDSVITPETTTSPTTTTATTTPGFTVGTAIVALLLLGWRQR